ncbi:MAG TPA: PIN domain-containing protein [Armatimonadota bacterium]|jgi:predicted nucleic acid-binding protein
MSTAAPLVIDAGALIAFLDYEPGAPIMAELYATRPSWHMHAINVCEVLYHYRRSIGEGGEEAAQERIDRAGIRVHEDLDPGFVLEVARLKADYARVSLADCCFLTLARRIGGEAVTTDHKEMDPLAPLKLCPITFIR